MSLTVFSIRYFSSHSIENELTGLSQVQKDLISTEQLYGAHNYHPLPVVLSSGKGVYLYDVDGKKYLDFLSAYSAVNQGHCHPKIIKALKKQAKTLTLTSRAFYNDKLGNFSKYLSDYFGGGLRVLPMNSGAEAVETAVKLSRKWAYEVKKVPEGKAKLLVVTNNFHGRTMLLVSLSTDPESYGGYAPFVPNIVKVPFNDIKAMEEAIQNDPYIAGVLIEPIQGEAGIIIPDDGYLSAVRQITKANNVLFIADEIQTGLCRTGKLLAIDYENITPDILILGKALSGGMLPISAVLARSEIMLTIHPGQHGSTYGGNPLACEVAIAALEVLRDENLAENAFNMGNLFRSLLLQIQSPMIEAVRGKGLMNAIVVKPINGKTAWDLCLMLRNKGLLAKPTHENIIRLAPPLVIKKSQIKSAVNIIKESISELASL